MLWILFGIVFFAVSYWLLLRPHNYWTDRGVKQGKPTFILGDNWKPLFKKQSVADMILTIYNMCPDVRYSGFYQFLTPTLVLKDPELIKQITVKDFDHFTDRQVLVPEEADPLLAKNLLTLKGQRWRDLRTTLSPVFTSSKIKHMFSLISQSSQQFVSHFLKKSEDIVTVEMKDSFTRFTTDVIASTAFGVECDSLSDRNNDLFLMGKQVTDFSGFWTSVKIFGYFLVPKLLQLLKVPLFPKKVGAFFNAVIKTNIESRLKHGTVRPDMIQLLLEARKNGLERELHSTEETGFATVQECEITGGHKTRKMDITDEDIASQAVIFFFAGFETVSSLMCFTSYELAVNPEIQRRLIEEVDETLEACNGKLTYEFLMGMKYMDMVIWESLRKWPNVSAIDRVCTEPYTIEPKHPDEKPLLLEKNTPVLLPIFGLHRDPQYYPEPDRFDPERFNYENIKKIKPFTYAPFGFGPRHCIGSRLGFLETKTLFFHILSHFEIVPVEKTQIPLKISKRKFNLTAEGGFWLGLKRRLKE